MGNVKDMQFAAFFFRVNSELRYLNGPYQPRISMDRMHSSNTVISSSSEDRMRQFRALHQSLLPAPQSIYFETHRPWFSRLAEAAKKDELAWYNEVPTHRSKLWETPFYPKLALRENGELIGFDLLRNRTYDQMDTWEFDFPMPNDADGSHGSLSGFPTFAFMLQNEIPRNTSPNIDLHVITKGLREFNAGDIRPKFVNPADPRQLNEELIYYVHTELNIRDYIASLINSDAFRVAANMPYQGKPIRRIVVNIILTGHFEVFGWDRTFHVDGTTAGDCLFVMSSAKPELLEHDARVPMNILDELQKQLVQVRLCQPENIRHIIRPNTADALRQMSLLPEFNDTDCFYLSLLYTLFLAMVEDFDSVENVQVLTQKKVWHTLRAAYVAYELRLLQLLETYSQYNVAQTRHTPLLLLLGPEWGAQFLNIRDATLRDTHGDALCYHWTEGWMQKR